MNHENEAKCLAELNATLDKYKAVLTPEVVITNEGVKLGMRLVDRKEA